MQFFELITLTNQLNAAGRQAFLTDVKNLSMNCEGELNCKEIQFLPSLVGLEW